ncbi:MAG: diphosphomevalonate decarboxylase [Saprospiraceae bacterium]|nr:diphosphomevalonate decarboxylase [Saprospiraceae bacterium]
MPSIKADQVGSVSWQSPSNIALIKYWGKHGNQLPNNPSISFTLSKSFSETTITYSPRTAFDRPISLDFYFEGKQNKPFSDRVRQYLTKLLPSFSYLSGIHLEISSSNSFPHSAGIASSASAFSALAMALCDIDILVGDSASASQIDIRKASEMARLGSGSACRSVYPKMALWGLTDQIEQSTDLASIPMGDQIHEVFKDYRDAILIASQDQKSVSSSIGHSLMQDHPFAETRYREARSNLNQILVALKSGDIEKMGFITEMEAMQLHALMLCSKPNYILLQPNTLQIIREIKNYRKESKVPVHFTLDAGPNVHILYPSSFRTEVRNLIEERLLIYCQDAKWIDDQVGDGPSKKNNGDKGGLLKYSPRAD